MTYKQAMNWLYGLQAIGMKFGMKNMRTLCRLMGNPQRQFKAVHIAGTNGKGSTAAFLTEIATRSGLKCGLTTSPHLLDLTERFRIGKRQISKSELARLTVELIETLDAYNASHPEEKLSPTFFEATVTLAFVYFAREAVDLAIVETGLGGRLDSTNVLKPILTLITSIGLEHTQYLGNTIRSVAREKAGIIKRGADVITAVKQTEALEVIEKRASAMGCRAHISGRDFAASLKGKQLAYKDSDGKKKRYALGLAGLHQGENAAMAVRAAEVLAALDFPITEASIRQGLKHVRWPARLELFEAPTPWLIDCAHNPAAMATVAAHLRANGSGGRTLAVFAAMSDKNYVEMMACLAPYVTDWVFTQPKIDRSLRPQTLLAACPAEGEKNCRRRVGQALALAASKESDYDRVLVTGSIFLVSEAYPFVQRHAGPSKLAAAQSTLWETS